MAIENLGDLNIEDSSSQTVPVCIHLLKHTDDGGKETGKWELSASVYTPQKGQVTEGIYLVADSREELVSLIQQYALPLYETALRVLKSICSGTDEGSLYYWDED